MMEYFSIMRRDGALAHAKIQMSLEKLIKEVSHKDCIISCHTNMKCQNKHTDKKYKSGW